MPDKSIINNLPHQETVASPFYKGLPINTTVNNPSFVSILDNTYNQLALVMARYTRTLVVRLDLHPAMNTSLYDVDMSKFCKSFSQKLSKKSFVKQEYGAHAIKSKPKLKKKAKYTSKIAYAWVRESGRNEYNEGVHWHIWVALKQDDNLQPHTQAGLVQKEIMASWEKYSGGANERNHMSAWFYLQRNSLTRSARLREQKTIAANPERPEGVLINSGVIAQRANNKNIVLGGVIDECFYALSYLAKVYSKVRTHRSKGHRLFASSNLNTKDSKIGRQKEIESNLESIHKNLSDHLAPMDIYEKYI